MKKKVSAKRKSGLNQGGAGDAGVGSKDSLRVQPQTGGIVPWISGWSPAHSQVLLVVVTILCLAPFSATAFRIDEPLFLWAAKQITMRPLDPYGFKLIWYTSEMPMSDVAKNPPLASYFIAVVASVAGWSERALRIAFLLPAIGVVLGTYHLARRYCTAPLLAAATTLLSPCFLISADSVMCDVMMLAFWILAVLLWIEGLEPARPLHLAASAVIMAVCALTKYFGMALIPLLFVYSLARQRRLGAWIWYLLIPVVILIGYQVWSQATYGRGLLLDAAAYASNLREKGGTSILSKALVSAAFLGGCAPAGLIFAPLLWSSRKLLIGILLSALAGLAVGTGLVNPGAPLIGQHALRLSIQLAICIAGGACILALAANSLRKPISADTLMLALWVVGTLFFAGFVNWTINGRSVLPLIPAAGVLLARRLEAVQRILDRALAPKLVAAVAVMVFFSLWVTWGDASLANSARQAASLIQEGTRQEKGTVWFQGHWGFQYYMQSVGARPIDLKRREMRAGDLVVIPDNNTNTFDINPRLAASERIVELQPHPWVTTMRPELGAGFYSNMWGPLPFAFGRVPPERYEILRLLPLKVRQESVR